jgi:hypothetical protein
MDSRASIILWRVSRFSTRSREVRWWDRRIVTKGAGPVLSRAVSSLFKPRSAACMWDNTRSSTRESVMSLGFHAVAIVFRRPRYRPLPNCSACPRSAGPVHDVCPHPVRSAEFDCQWWCLGRIAADRAVAQGAILAASPSGVAQPASFGIVFGRLRSSKSTQRKPTLFLLERQWRSCNLQTRMDASLGAAL